MQLGIAELDDGGFASQQIADIDGKHAGFQLLQHDRGIAVGYRLLVLILGLLTFLDGSLQLPVAQFYGKLQQHRIQRQGKSIDRLDRLYFIVLVGL